MLANCVSNPQRCAENFDLTVKKKKKKEYSLFLFCILCFVLMFVSFVCSFAYFDILKTKKGSVTKKNTKHKKYAYVE